MSWEELKLWTMAFQTCSHETFSTLHKLPTVHHRTKKNALSPKVAQRGKTTTVKTNQLHCCIAASQHVAALHKRLWLWKIPLTHILNTCLQPWLAQAAGPCWPALTFMASRRPKAVAVPAQATLAALPCRTLLCRLRWH